KTASTPIETNKAFLKDEEAKDMDVHLYRSMIGSLMYLTASRPDIMFAVCAYRDYAGASLDRKSITGDVISDEFGVKTGSEPKLVLNGCMDWNETTAHHEIQIRALVDGKKIIITEASIRCDLQLQDVEGTTFLPNDTIFEELERMRVNFPVYDRILDLDSRGKVKENSSRITTAATTPQISKDELTLVQNLIEIKAAKSKARGVRVQEPSEFRTTSSSQPSQLPQAKDKEIVEERSKKTQVEVTEGSSKRAGDELEQESAKRQKLKKLIIREKDKGNIVVIEQWNEVQAKIDADIELAQKLQTKEQEHLTDVEKARLFMEFLEKRRKVFARKREIENKNRPPTKPQQRNLSYEKGKHIVDMNTEIVEERSKKTQAEVTEGSSKRAGDELEQESAKR
nr:ribonuclease H-like domain, reverse transcriptase, RNA-dependent DNA polymerase [Tanacetum cinerariifolium]